MNDSQIAIIGGHGQMGRMLDKRFSDVGLKVLCLDQPLPEDELEALLSPCRLVILAVPISVFAQVTELIAPRMAQGTILTDICSVKVTPLMHMERLYTGPVVGTHPLFGPDPKPDHELKVALCPGTGTDQNSVELVEKIFNKAGMRTFICSAREHDQAMACIQSLNFVTTISYFASLPQDLDLEKFSTPSFMRRLNSARKMLNEDAYLFSSLAEDNPYTGQMIRRFKSFLNLSAAGELELLQDKALWWWRNENEKGGP
ncbi:prephenate dehydrogenase [Desulfonatronovibrio magnus]|uniref:prephenate dehydrogenase n=1 Tax=Desulfonatronovibrio magnus TaxID=698827 RepID=UPI0005EAEB95|nr:prephenate dehydrogenase [Desulfonatronovibrio magnus]